MTITTRTTAINDPHGLRAQALTAASKHDYLEAIAACALYLQGRQDPEMERSLLEWRIQAFAALPPSAPRPVWPPIYADPFPQHSGVPEVTLEQLTHEVMAGAILHHGSLLVRGMLAPQVADSYTTVMDQAFAERAAHRGQYVDANATPRYRQLPLPEDNSISISRGWVEEGDSAILLADSPRTAAEFIVTLRELGIVSLIESYMGETPALSAGKTTLRRVPPTMSVSSWHQDGAFLGKDIRSINLWLCLSDAGVDASGLDLVPKRLDYLAETGTGNAYFDWDVGDDIVNAVAGDAGTASPVFRPGDAMLFDHMMLHRTGLPSGMTRDRYAIEAWMFAPSHYPMDQTPLVL